MTAAQPLARYGAMWKARVASGSATLELHYFLGHDRNSSSVGFFSGRTDSDVEIAVWFLRRRARTAKLARLSQPHMN
jgi:hypothetical protein